MKNVGSGMGLRWKVVILLSLAMPAIAADSSKSRHDETFRPTVLIRQGKSLGTGTIIASVEGATLVLTAWHVVDGLDGISVELNRFNVGLEKTRSLAGYPRRLVARVLTKDADADLAILLIRGQLALPYVVSLAPGDAPPSSGTGVMTIGFDKGEKLIGFGTRIKTVEKLDFGHGGGERSFLVTTDPPELGRSGGGLFLATGELVGVCVARAELDKGRKIGLFATLRDVKKLIHNDDEITATLAKSIQLAKARAR